MNPKWTGYHTAAVLLIPAGIIGLAFLSARTGFFAAWILNMALMAVFIIILGHGIMGLKRGALIDDRNKISLSRLQLFLWTVLILSAIITAAILNVYRGESDALAIGVPTQIWWLMGISTTSLVGSTLIKSTKKDQSPDPVEAQNTLAAIARTSDVAATTSGKLIVKSQPADASWYDLFMGEETGNGARLDLGKVQMFYFTWILVIAYGAALASSFRGLSTVHAFPALSDSVVALLGISHAGYLTNKAVPHSKSV